MNKQRINNERFSISLCTVAKTYGFKTIGTMHKALKQACPNTKWQRNTSYVRGAILLKEIETYLNPEKYYLTGF